MSQERNQPRRPLRRIAIRFAVSLTILLALFLWLRPSNLLLAMAQIPVQLWLALVLGTMLCHVITAWKWRILLLASGHRPTVREVLTAHGSGLFANIWLPSIIGGDIVRLGCLTTGGRDIGGVLTSLIADRVIDATALLLLVAFGAAFTPASLVGPAQPFFWIVSGGLLLGLLGSAFAVHRVSFERRTGRWWAVLQQMHAAAVTLLGRRGGGRLLGALTVALIVQAFLVLLTIPLARGVGIHLPLALWFTLWPLAKLIAMLPISLGGLGVRETAMVTLLSPFGTPATLVVAHALLWQTVLLGVGLAAGAISALFRPAGRPPLLAWLRQRPTAPQEDPRSAVER